MRPPAPRPYLARPRPSAAQAVTSTVALLTVSPHTDTDDVSPVRPYTTDPDLRALRQTLNTARVYQDQAGIALLRSLADQQGEGSR